MSSSSSISDDFAPSASWGHLKLRADILKRLRTFFDQHGLLEVETPLLSADTVVDQYLDPVPVTLFSDPQDTERGRSMWLQTSPEFGMKRLMCAGAEAIYQVTRAFRAGETGRLHNPEFTIVEWYQRDRSMSQGIQFLSDLAESLLQRGPVRRTAYRDAFRQGLDIDPFTCSIMDCADVAKCLDIEPPATLLADQQETEDNKDQWLNFLLGTAVEPNLGNGRPQILYDYPPSQAALAEVRQDNDGTQAAERFELYVDGVELANGYHELRDPDVLHKRNQKINRLRVKEGKYTLPNHSRLHAAMTGGLPDCTGVALGFDRLVMIIAGATCLEEVMAFPIDRA